MENYYVQLSNGSKFAPESTFGNVGRYFFINTGIWWVKLGKQLSIRYQTAGPAPSRGLFTHKCTVLRLRITGLEKHFASSCFRTHLALVPENINRFCACTYLYMYIHIDSYVVHVVDKFKQVICLSIPQTLEYINGQFKSLKWHFARPLSQT